MNTDQRNPTTGTGGRPSAKLDQAHLAAVVNSSEDETAALRSEAKARLTEKHASRAGDSAPESSEKLIHELEVHRVELEMQNEELMLAQGELTSAADRYTALYNFAPTGYFTLDPDGKIAETNLAGARLLGTERTRLKGKRLAAFVADPPAFAAFLDRVMSGEPQQSCELDLAGPDQTPRTVLIEATLSPGNLEECWISAIDITERKQVEAKLKGQLDELQRWHDATLGREGRIQELKREINRLLVASGQPPRFASVAEEDER